MRVCLRNVIETDKAWYKQKYGELNWHWYDEGLVWAVQDYHSCKGSVLDFMEDDWLAAEENGLSRPEVEDLCEEE